MKTDKKVNVVAKDITGKVINIGDEVAFTAYPRVTIKKGKVTKISESGKTLTVNSNRERYIRHSQKTETVYCSYIKRSATVVKFFAGEDGEDLHESYVDGWNSGYYEGFYDGQKQC